jgi:hypothetical protein
MKEPGPWAEIILNVIAGVSIMVIILASISIWFTLSGP